jgi:SAM-dependent methyltransferase
MLIRLYAGPIKGKRGDGMSVKSTIKQYVPSSILSGVSNFRLRRAMNRSKGRTPAQIFGEIYERNAWGGEAGNFSSGSGSAERVNDDYVELVLSLIRRGNVRSIVDLGCGDFKVGARMVESGVSYIGCDVYPKLIEQNSRKFGRANVTFRVLDIVADPLPEGDLCIIRQVFQHLSNDNIVEVLRKARIYPLVLITDEQISDDDASSNANILPFHGTRRVFGQGLKLERAPFDETFEVLLNHSSGSGYDNATRTYLRTVLIRH